MNSAGARVTVSSHSNVRDHPWLGVPAGRGRCPRGYPRASWAALCCSSFARPARSPAGRRALPVPCAYAGRKGSVASLPASRPCPRLASGRRALAPSGPGAGGRGWVPSRPCRPLPAGASAASCGGWVAGSLGSLRLFWGCVVVSLSVPVASRVVLAARCGLAPWAGSALGVSFRASSVALSGVVAVVRFSSPAAAAASPARGRVACRRRAVVAAFARWPVSAGWSRCRSPRRPFRFAGVARRAAWPPCSPPGAGLRRVALPPSRRRWWPGGRLAGGLGPRFRRWPPFSPCAARRLGCAGGAGLSAFRAPFARLFAASASGRRARSVRRPLGGPCALAVGGPVRVLALRRPCFVPSLGRSRRSRVGVVGVRRVRGGLGLPLCRVRRAVFLGCPWASLGSRRFRSSWAAGFLLR